MTARSKKSNILNRFQFSENTILLGVAIGVGLATGISIWLFREAIHFVEHTVREEFAGHTLAGILSSIGIDPRFAFVILLAGIGFIVGLIMHVFVGHEKYHGVAGIMESVALTGGRLKYTKTPFKAIASVLSLGGGASVGPEDPSVQIGSNIGSFFGQVLFLSEERVKLLVSAGAASAIAAAFNAPIAGVFFALEVILGEFSTRSFSIVVLSAVVSAGFMSAVGSGNPVFGDLNYTLGNPLQLPFYVVLGLILGVVSSLAIRFFHWQSHVWHNLIHLPIPIETMITGAFVGLVGAFFFPEILGSSEGFMHEVLTGHTDLAIQVLIVLGVAKLVMTAISLGGGFVGGVFAPTLFIGIMFGTAFGKFALRFADSTMVGNPQAYAIAGMAGLMAGIVRAPITAIMLVFELTDDYQLILPIMLTSVICVVFVERIGPAGIYALSLIRNGIHLQYGRDVDVMQGITVGEAMVSPAPRIEDTSTLKELRDALKFQHARALAVVDHDGKYLGIVTLSDLQAGFDKALEDPNLDVKDLRVADIYTHETITISPDEALWSAIRIMGRHDIGHVPVLKRGTDTLLGMLRRNDIMDAYNVAIMKKFHEHSTANKIRLETLTGADVVEYHLAKSSPIIGNRIRELKLPPQTVIASIQRHHKLIVPRGDSLFHSGDVVTVVVDKNHIEELNELFGVRGLQSAH